jgi:hypothetical protein
VELLFAARIITRGSDLRWVCGTLRCANPGCSLSISAPRSSAAVGATITFATSSELVERNPLPGLCLPQTLLCPLECARDSIEQFNGPHMIM